MSEFVGERLDDLGVALPGRYVRVPVAASAMVRDDRAIDAGAAMIFHNNLSHAASEALRHLFDWVRGGTLSQVDGWTGVVDASNPGTGGLANISWSPVVSCCWGPFFAIEDRISLASDTPTPPSPGVAVPRKIALEVEAKSGALGTLNLYPAVTAGWDPQLPYLGTVWDTTYSPGTSLAVTTTTIAIPRPLSPSAPVRSRPAAGAASGGAEATVLPYWIWLGWRSTSGSDKILAVTAYETR